MSKQIKTADSHIRETGTRKHLVFLQEELL